MKEHEDERETDASCGRKSMKLADLEEDHEGEEEKREEDNTSKNEIDGEKKSLERVCPICSKTFSSGKALGGHVSSAHVQAKGQKVKSSSKKLMKRKHENNNHGKSVAGHDDFIDEFDEDGDYCSQRLIGKMEFKKKISGFNCRYCGKDFPSKKSLFGHMRCHPDRPYRGMDPPDSNNNPANDGEINNSSMPYFNKSELEELHGEEEAVGNQENVVNLAQELVGRGWYVKGRRGANPSSATTLDTEEKSNSNSIGHDEMYGDDVNSFEQSCLASYLLMHLHNSGGSRSNLHVGNVAAEAEELLLDFAMSKKIGGEKSEQASNEEEAEDEAAGMIDQLKKARSEAILENGKDGNSSDDTKSDDQLRKLDYARKGKGKIVEQKKRGKCNNATKKIIIRIKDKLPSSSAGVGDDHVTAPPPPPPPPPPPSSVAENGREFVCNTCGKTYATHQALGGHKSSHNKFRISIHNTIDDEELPLVVDNQKMIYGQSSASKGRRICKKRKNAVAPEVQKVLDFDLNELPEGES